MLSVLLVVAAAPARSQLIGNRTQANCASVTRGNVENSTVTVVCGMPHEQVVELVRLAASPAAGDRATLLGRLNAIIPANGRFAAEAVARFLEILHERPIEETKLVRAFRVSDPEVQALRDAAALQAL
jgi:hypothetical protein